MFSVLLILIFAASLVWGQPGTTLCMELRQQMRESLEHIREALETIADRL